MARIASLVMLLFTFTSEGFAQVRFEQRPEWGKLFVSQGVKGSFLLYDLKQDKFFAYDSARCMQRFPPASTFKIFNSLVALETEVIPDEHMVLKWDGVDKGRTSWNQDQDTETAIKNSTVWYYQELARRIGRPRMREYIESEHYGNMDISGDIDKFWLNGTLQISQAEQITFLRKLYAGLLHFSKHNMDIVKRIIILKDTAGYVLRGKTGWADLPRKNIGWLVGYLEQNQSVYFFATNIESPDPAPENFMTARREITDAILKSLGLL